MHLLTLLLVMLFALVIAYFCYSVYFYGGRWVANPYNPRISSQKQHVIMGTLTDRDGTVLAYTDEDGQRRYNNSADTRKAVCQVVGDSGGKVSTGADTFHAQFLLGFRSSIFERLADAFTGTTQRGDDVRLTISERLSRYISEQFPKGKRGAVVVLNYKTNEILAMVSMPQFDPTNMDAALSDESAGALINRATQGLYPPGSTFKIVTLASALENLPISMTLRLTARAIIPSAIIPSQTAARMGCRACPTRLRTRAIRPSPRFRRISAMRCWDRRRRRWVSMRISCSAI